MTYRIGRWTAAIAGAAASSFVCLAAQASLVVLDTANLRLGTLVGLGFDTTTSRIWVYGDFDEDLNGCNDDGTILSSIAEPGEGANDADVEFAPEALTLNNVSVPTGTLLFINGESGVAEIYAVDKVTGNVLATLVTSFGASHVVGGGYHSERETFFLVQDKVPGGTDANRIAEVNRNDGGVLNTFQVTGTFSVNFGDLDVGPNGNLFVVSSDEPRVGEYTPTGQFVQYHPLPAGVSGLSGIGFIGSCGEAWVAGTGGTIWHLSGFPASQNSPDLDGNGHVDAADLAILLGAWGPCPGCCPADLDGNGTVDAADLAILLGAWG